ncbi:uncharacterized protein L203_103504 [Cryptococcus depauperatus CBS 7841]|uniref:NAD(P)-binding domain-containing protein n=1 Tax=Cryptococcus depauperatus CBS 7841 TaxID=1295531 RepID=A0AAJ8JTU9_9TREE
MLTRRLTSTIIVPPHDKPSRKIVLVGAGFLGSYIARSLVADPRNKIKIVSRHPEALYSKLSTLGSQILPPTSTDISSPECFPHLCKAMEGASAVVSMAGLLVGSDEHMKALQEDGAKRVGEAAKKAGIRRVVGISAIGADPKAITAYWRTKANGEQAIWDNHPSASIIRPSILFGPGDSFFNRFATLAKYLPFLPVFGGGTVKFQPVYVGDVARAVEICCRDDPQLVQKVGGRIIEAGGPDILTYREIMQLVLRYTRLEGRRAIISLPYWLGTMQGFILEKLPESIFTLTRAQVAQLKFDNIVSPHLSMPSQDFQDLLKAFPSPATSSVPPGEVELKSVYGMLPTYLGVEEREKGKRTNGKRPTSLQEVSSLRRK